MTPRDGEGPEIYLSNNYFIMISNNENVTIMDVTTEVEGSISAELSGKCDNFQLDNETFTPCSYEGGYCGNNLNISEFNNTEIVYNSDGNYSSNLNYNISISTEEEVNVTKKVLNKSYCNGLRVPMGMLIMLYNKTSPFENAIYYLTESDYIISVNGDIYVHNVSINNTMKEYSIYEADGVNSQISGNCKGSILEKCVLDGENSNKTCKNETGVVDFKIKYENGKLGVIDMSDYVIKVITDSNSLNMINEFKKGETCSKRRLPSIDMNLNITIPGSNNNNEYIFITEDYMIYLKDNSKYSIFDYTISSNNSEEGTKFTAIKRYDEMSGECNNNNYNNGFKNCSIITCEDVNNKEIYLYYDYTEKKIKRINNNNNIIDEISNDKFIDSLLNNNYCDPENVPLEKYFELSNTENTEIRYVTDKYLVLYKNDSEYYVYDIKRENSMRGSVGTKFIIGDLISGKSGTCSSGKLEIPTGDNKVNETGKTIVIRYKDGIIQSENYVHSLILNETENITTIYRIDKIIDGKYCNKQITENYSFKITNNNNNNNIIIYTNPNYYIFIDSSKRYRIISDSNVSYSPSKYGIQLSLMNDSIYSDLSGCCSDSNSQGSIQHCDDINAIESVQITCFKRVYNNNNGEGKKICYLEGKEFENYTVTDITNTKGEMNDYLLGFNCNYYTQIPSTISVKLQSNDEKYLMYFTQNELIMINEEKVRVYNITKSKENFHTKYTIHNYIESKSGECIDETMNYCNYFSSDICRMKDYEYIRLKNSREKYEIEFEPNKVNPIGNNYKTFPILKDSEINKEIDNVLERKYCNEKGRVSNGSILKLSKENSVIYLLNNYTAVFINNDTEKENEKDNKKENNNNTIKVEVYNITSIIDKNKDNKTVGTIYSVKENMIKERSGICDNNKKEFSSCLRSFDDDSENSTCVKDSMNINITVVQNVNSSDYNNDDFISYQLMNISGENNDKYEDFRGYSIENLTDSNSIQELYSYIYGTFCNGKKIPENSFILFRDESVNNNNNNNNNIEILLGDEGIVYYYKDDESVSSFQVEKEKISESSSNVDNNNGSIYYIQRNEYSRDLSFTGKCVNGIFTSCNDNPNLAICRKEPENENITLAAELNYTSLLLSSDTINDKEPLLMTLSEQKKRITDSMYGKVCNVISNNYNNKTVPNGIYISLIKTTITINKKESKNSNENGNDNNINENEDTTTEEEIEEIIEEEEYYLTDNYLMQKNDDDNEVVVYKVTKTQITTNKGIILSQYTIGEMERILSGKCENSILKNCTVNSENNNNNNNFSPCNITDKPFGVESFTLTYETNDLGPVITTSIENVTGNYGGFELSLTVKPILKGVYCNKNNTVQNGKYLVITEKSGSKVIYLSESHYIVLENDYFYIYNVTNKTLNGEKDGSVYTFEVNYTKEISGSCMSDFVNCNAENSGCINSTLEINNITVTYMYNATTDEDVYDVYETANKTVREASKSEIDSIHRMLSGSYCKGSFVPPDTYFQILSKDNLTEFYLTDNRYVHIRNYEVFVHEMNKAIAPSGSGNIYTLGNVVAQSSMKCNTDYECVENEASPVRCIGEFLSQISFNIKYINSKNIQLIRPEGYRIILIEDGGKKAQIDNYTKGEYCDKKRLPLGSYITIQNYKDSSTAYFIYEDRFVVYDFYKMNVYKMNVNSLTNDEGNLYEIIGMDEDYSGYCKRGGDFVKSNEIIGFINSSFIIKNDTGKLIIEYNKDGINMSDYNITISSLDNKRDVTTIMEKRICSTTYIHTNTYIKINNNEHQIFLTDFNYVYVKKNGLSYVYNVTKNSDSTKSTYTPTEFIRMCDTSLSICSTCESDDYYRPNMCELDSSKPPLSSTLIKPVIQYYFSIRQLIVDSPSRAYEGMIVNNETTNPSRNIVNNYLEGVYMNLNNRLFVNTFSGNSTDSNYTLFFAHNRMAIIDNLEENTIVLYRMEGVKNDALKGSTFNIKNLIKERTGFCDGEKFNSSMDDNDHYIKEIYFYESNDEEKEIIVNITYSSNRKQSFNCSYDDEALELVNIYTHNNYCNLDNKFILKKSLIGFSNDKESPVYMNDEFMYYTVGKKVYTFNFTKTDTKSGNYSLYSGFNFIKDLSGYCNYKDFIKENETELEFDNLTISIDENGDAKNVSADNPTDFYFIDDSKTSNIINVITQCKNRIPIGAYIKISNIKTERFDTIYLTDDYFILYNSTILSMEVYNVSITFATFGHNYEAKELIESSSGYCDINTKELVKCDVNNNKEKYNYYCNINPHEINYFNISYQINENGVGQFFVNGWKNNKIPKDLNIKFIDSTSDEIDDINRIINGTYCKDYKIPTTLPPTTLPPSTVIPTTETPIDDSTPEETGKTEIPTTKPPLPFVPCSYEKDVYKYFYNSNVDTFIDPTTVNEFNGDKIKYDIKCQENDFISYDKEDGRFTVSLSSKPLNKNEYILCEVRCYINDSYNDGNTNVGFYIRDYKPFIDLFDSSTPIQIENDTEFNVTLKIAYPTAENGENTPEPHTYNLKLTLNDDTNTYSLANDGNNNKVRNQLTFKWKNQKVNQILPDDQVNDTFVTLKIQSDSNNNNNEISYETHPIPILKEKGKCIYGSFDDDGICCKRKYDGELCTNVTVTYSFLKGNGNFNAFKVKFIDILQNYLFKGTSYWSTCDNSNSNSDESKIRLNIRYIGNARNYLNKMDILSNERILQSDNNSTTPPPPMHRLEYIKTILKAIYPTDEIAAFAEDEKVNGNNNNNNRVKEDLVETTTQPPIISLPPEFEHFEELQRIKDVLVTVIKEVSLVARDEKIKANPDDYVQAEKFQSDFEGGELIIKEKEDPWAERYWYVILIIVLVVIVLLILLALIVYQCNKIAVRKSEEERNKKFVDESVPIVKIKEENKVNDDSIYKNYENKIIMEGYLLKEGRNRISVDKFQKRYCTLYFEPSVFRIYESMSHSYYGNVYLNERQAFPMSCYDSVEYEENADDFTVIFKVKDASMKVCEKGEEERRIHFKVDGEDGFIIAKKWVEKFRNYESQKPESIEAWNCPRPLIKENNKFVVESRKVVDDRNLTLMEEYEEQSTHSGDSSGDEYKE